MGNPLVTIDAGRGLGEELLVHGFHEILLFRDNFRAELVAMLAIGGIVFLEFRPHRLGHAQPFHLEFFLGGDDPARFLDRIVNACLRLVPEQLGILVRNVTVMTTGLDAETVGVVHALRVFLGHPLHGVAGGAAEFVGAGRSHHDLRADDAAGGTMDDVTFNHVFLKDWADYAAINGVYAAYFPGEKPARYCIQCGLVKKEAPIHISNVMLWDAKKGEHTKVKRSRETGKLVRISKKSGEVIK